MANNKLFRLSCFSEYYASEDKDYINPLDHELNGLIFYANSKEEAEKLCSHYIANEVIDLGLLEFEDTCISILNKSDNYEQFCDEIVKEFGHKLEYYNPENNTFNIAYFQIDEISPNEVKDAIKKYDDNIETTFNNIKSINMEDI